MMPQSVLLLVLMSQCSFILCHDYGYHFINVAKNWSEAQQYCQDHYTDLATVYDTTGAERICGRAARCNGAWIGLYNKTSINSTWYWSQPGLVYRHSLANWGKNQPNDYLNENCVYVEGSSWNDAGCGVPRGFICYNNSSGRNFTYVGNNKTKTWLEALQFCRKYHSDLISVQQLQGPCEICWIGLFRDTWGWSDRSNSSFRNWHENETVLNKPPQGAGNCVRLGEENKWRSDKCAATHPFICYDDRMILVKENKTWEEALYYCRRNHDDLAVMNNQHQLRMVQERADMADSAFVWVGLYYTCFLEDWVWVDGRNASYLIWENREPHDCGVAGAMKKGRKEWFKQSSENKYNFVCSVRC